MKALTFRQFLFENKFTELAGKYIDTEYTPGWRENAGKGPQRYLNKEDNRKLKVLKFIFDSGKEGRSYREIQKFYYDLGADEEGKRSRWNPGEWDPETRTRKGSGDEYREYDPKKDRGMGGTMLSGGDWWGKPTGILHAHCIKNKNDKWVLVDKKLINIFEFVDISDDGDIEMIRSLGLLDDL